MDELTVEFVSLGPKSFSMKVLKSDTIGKVKAKIHHDRGLPLKNLVLSFPARDGRHIISAEDHRVMSEFANSDGSSIIVLFDTIDTNQPAPSFERKRKRKRTGTSAAAEEEKKIINLDVEEKEEEKIINLDVEARWKRKAFVEATRTVGYLKKLIGEEETTVVERISVSCGGITLPDTQSLSDISDLKVVMQRYAHPLKIKLVSRNQSVEVKSLWKIPLAVNAEAKVSTLRETMRKEEIESETVMYPASFVFTRGYELLDEDKTYLENGIKHGEKIFVFDIGATSRSS